MVGNNSLGNSTLTSLPSSGRSYSLGCPRVTPNWLFIIFSPRTMFLLSSSLLRRIHLLRGSLSLSRSSVPTGEEGGGGEMRLQAFFPQKKVQISYLIIKISLDPYSLDRGVVPLYPGVEVEALEQHGLHGLGHHGVIVRDYSLQGRSGKKNCRRKPASLSTPYKNKYKALF